MKKLILFAAILFAGVSVVNAQSQIVKPNYQSKGPQTVTEGSNLIASTKLTVQLNSIQSISVNTSNVSLVYTTVGDYLNGVSSGDIPGHLEVNSTGGYKVSVHYDTPLVSGSESTYEGNLDAESMFNSITVAVKANESVGKVANKKLANSGVDIINSTTGEFGALFDVDYQGAANYIKSIKGGAQRTYTAQVIYTIAPK